MTTQMDFFEMLELSNKAEAAEYADQPTLVEHDDDGAKIYALSWNRACNEHNRVPR